MIRRNRVASISLLLIALALPAAGCSPSGGAGGREPSIRGVITGAAGQDDRATIMVVWSGELGAQMELDAASLTIDDKTDISARKDVAGFRRGEELSPGDLRTGLVIEAWIDGPILESYPAQAGASRVEVVGEWEDEMPKPQGLQAPITE